MFNHTDCRIAPSGFGTSPAPSGSGVSSVLQGPWSIKEPQTEGRGALLSVLLPWLPLKKKKNAAILQFFPLLLLLLLAGSSLWLPGTFTEPGMTMTRTSRLPSPPYKNIHVALFQLFRQVSNFGNLNCQQKLIITRYWTFCWHSDIVMIIWLITMVVITIRFTIFWPSAQCHPGSLPPRRTASPWSARPRAKGKLHQKNMVVGDR